MPAAYCARVVMLARCQSDACSLSCKSGDACTMIGACLQCIVREWHHLESEGPFFEFVLEPSPDCVSQEKDIGTNSEHRPTTGVQKGRKVENLECANKHD